jgi:DNA-binding IclR family transcriptional regulator
MARERVCSLTGAAEQMDMPLSTVHRLARVLARHGYLIRLGRGRYCLGGAVLHLARDLRLEDLLVTVGRPIIADLARRTRASINLGVFDGDMVTYLVKQSFGRDKIFSREGMQLEAYCSGIGKVLLAYLPEPALEQYLAGGAFVALTPRTITAPEQLSQLLRTVRQRGWAVDDEEILTGLRCLAVPIAGADGAICAALSVSTQARKMTDERMMAFLPILQAAASEISQSIFGEHVRPDFLAALRHPPPSAS